MDVSQTLVSFIHTAFLVMVYHTWTKKKKKNLGFGPPQPHASFQT